MDENQLACYLEQISEQVVDENRIVTYKSLSKSLGIHVNTAKQLLYVYATKEKSKNAYPISATYLVAGKVVDGSFNITIVNESDLKQAYSGFIEVTSEHVYSVQKVKNLKDINVLCGVCKGISKPENCDPVIKCSKAVLKLRRKPIKKVELCKEENQKIIKEASGLEKEPVVKVKPSPKNISPKESLGKAQSNKKSTGNISNFFAKSSSKNLGKTIKNETKIVEKENEVEFKKTEKESSGKESFERNEKGSKRKRIQTFDDSEDSESNEDEKSHASTEEDSLPPTVNLEEKEETVEKNRRKKRKVIDKTLMNADGYLETKKEIVFETDSENEPEETICTKEFKKPKEEKKAQKTASHRKQATLLNFFKKN